jgi:hypothetical protein
MATYATTHIVHGAGEATLHFQAGELVPDGTMSEQELDDLLSVGAVEVTEDEPLGEDKDVEAGAAAKGSNASGK